MCCWIIREVAALSFVGSTPVARYLQDCAPPAHGQAGAGARAAPRITWS